MSLIGVNVSPVGETFKIVKGFWDIADALNSCWNGARINKFKSKRLAERRNLVMKEIEKLPTNLKSQVKDCLTAFDNSFIELIETFRENNFVVKMLFRKSDHKFFETLFNDLEKIRQSYTKQQLDLSQIQNENCLDILDDFRSDKELLKSNIDKISTPEKREIQSNFTEFKNVVTVAAQTISSAGIIDTSINLQDINTILEDVEVILDNYVVAEPLASIVISTAPLLSSSSSQSATTVFNRDRSPTTAEELAEYTHYWKNWFKSHVSSIKPGNGSIYAKIFYDENVTTEDRLVKSLDKNKNWLIEHKVLEFDADDIIIYLKSVGKMPSSSNVSQVNHRPIESTSTAAFTTPSLVLRSAEKRKNNIDDEHEGENSKKGKYESHGEYVAAISHSGGSKRNSVTGRECI